MSQITLCNAVDCLRMGKVIAYPTEAVYGLGCDPFNKAAFSELLALKQRPLEKGVILIAGDLSQLHGLVLLENQPWQNQVLQSWQGSIPTTWVLPATDQVPDWVTGGRDTVAVRVTQHPTVRALCAKWGKPLVSTSANLSGQEPVRSAEQCQETFPHTPILQGELMGVADPSQIWDASSLTRLR